MQALVADAAETVGSASHVRIECRLDGSTTLLQPDMSGYARIDTGKRTAGAILIDRVLPHLKTEYRWQRVHG